jgi:hypothetical protein
MVRSLIQISNSPPCIATVSRSRRAFSREFCQKNPALQSEGAGNAGRSMRPQPRVQIKKAHEQVTTVTPVSPGIPRAMVLTVSFVLSPVTGLVCHRHLAESLPPT